MIENRELTMDDYLAMLRRRLKVILIPTLLAPLVGFAVSYAFAPKYTSTSMVLVQEQKVPEGYVKPAITEDLSQRVATLEQRALGADQLRPLIDRLQLAKGNRGIEDVIDEIRTNINIAPVDAATIPTPGKKNLLQGGVPGFNVSYTSSNPRQAQEVCAGLTDIMLNVNFKDRAQVAQSTTEFLGRQANEAKAALDTQDRQLAAFKARYVGQLPGEEYNNLKVLRSLK
jgi:uncharacterized protein involved in exopolysaccharide biosynthesis